jgi:hypothetical protein
MNADDIIHTAAGLRKDEDYYIRIEALCIAPIYVYSNGNRIILCYIYSGAQRGTF